MTDPRPQRPDPWDDYPNSNTVDIAVLYERIGHFVKQVEVGFKSLGDQEDQRVEANSKVALRVARIENQIASARWFITGLAAGGGVLGGVVSALLTGMFGG